MLYYAMSDEDKTMNQFGKYWRKKALESSRLDKDDTEEQQKTISNKNERLLSVRHLNQPNANRSTHLQK